MGHNRLFKAKFSGLWFGFLLVGIWSLFACQLPGLVAQSFNQATPTVSSTEYPGPSLSPAYPGLDATPTGEMTSVPYPQLSAVVPLATDTGLGYPPVDTFQPGYPYLEPGVFETFSPYPELRDTATTTLSAPASAASPTPTSTATIQRTGTVTRTPTVTPTSGAVRSLTPTATHTPVRMPSLTPTQTLSGGGYPGPGSEYPPPTFDTGGYPYPGAEQPTFTSRPGAGTFTPTSTPVFQPSPTFMTPTPVYAFPATPTPVRYQTPTPTRTPTPTVTPTRRPAPPWISSQLRATDPDTVRLVSGKVQLIMFFAFWSGPCQAMAPVVHNLQAEYGGQMNFVYLDIDDPATDELKDQLGYRFEPHFFLVDAQGKIIQQWVGYVSYETFTQAIEAALP